MARGSIRIMPIRINFLIYERRLSILITGLKIVFINYSSFRTNAI